MITKPSQAIIHISLIVGVIAGLIVGAIVFASNQASKPKATITGEQLKELCAAHDIPLSKCKVRKNVYKTTTGR